MVSTGAVDRFIAGRRPAGTEKGDHVPEDATTPERSPVVASIVTSERGVLIGRRNDGNPPWTFIAGEIEPGESSADAAVREVKEETGLLVRAAEREIGRRVHPNTGRTMVYLACYPTGKLDVFVGDEDELAEVKWASLDEVQQLLPKMFDRVLEHLQRELGTAS
ncbi:NUDIX hydrolase [Micromonospora acroterricola]|uniref:NUDIX hydrolase n=2 Tax=Micromonospora acroterricola TaxID=2202421 RepID=A0A317D166_9ACTN|nr:NUDIX hydrolase [Micromonospora acroterricola]